MCARMEESDRPCVNETRCFLRGEMNAWVFYPSILEIRFQDVVISGTKGTLAL